MTTPNVGKVYDLGLGYEHAFLIEIPEGFSFRSAKLLGPGVVVHDSSGLLRYEKSDVQILRIGIVKDSNSLAESVSSS